MWRAGRHVQRSDVTPPPVSHRHPPPPLPGQRLPHCSLTRGQPNLLGHGSAFGDPTSSVAGIVLSASDSNVVVLFCQGTGRSRFGHSSIA